ncbi:MAG TPA: hypothetical protein VFL83_03175, partial [Anaeromyxobacter sp.]|nr:hypothetical protein [Anaeromyxobacter sp.]
VALSNLYPEAKSVGAWLRHGWHVAVAYVVGYAAITLIVGWHPSPTRAPRPPELPPAVAPAAPAPAAPLRPPPEAASRRVGEAGR